MIGNNACGSRALGYGRTVDNVVGLECSPLAGERLALGGVPTASPLLDRLDALVDEPPRARSAPSSAGSAGRSPATPWSTCCPSTAATSTASWSAREGTLGVVARGHRPAGRGRAARALAVLGYPTMFEAADAVPALLRPPAGRLRGPGLAGSSTWSARRGAVPDLPRGAGWLFAEVTGADAGRGRGARPPRSAADAGAVDVPRGHRRRRDGRAVADPRGRRRAGRPHAWTGRRSPAGRTPRSRRSGSAPTCATSTRCCARPASTACPTATSATAACTCASTSRSTRARRAGAASGRSSRPPRDLTAAHGGSAVRRARRRPGPLGAAAADVLRRR